MAGEEKKVLTWDSPVMTATILTAPKAPTTASCHEEWQELMAEFRVSEPEASNEELMAFLRNIIAVKNKKVRRPSVLPGDTQKIKVGSKTNGQKQSTIYVTINSVLEDGGYWPYEVFFNCSDTRLAGWLAALAKTTSAFMKITKDFHQDPLFIAKNLESIQGEGYFDSDSGLYINSIQAHLGLAIRWNIERGRKMIEAAKSDDATVALPKQRDKAFESYYDVCPECGQNTLLISGGCRECENCGHSGGCG